VNEFGCKFWRELARENGNVIISPFNISTALAMVKAGARADTEAEISTVLGPAPDADGIERLTNLANTRGDQLLHAGGLWIENAVADTVLVQREMESGRPLLASIAISRAQFGRPPM